MPGLPHRSPGASESRQDTSCRCIPPGHHHPCHQKLVTCLGPEAHLPDLLLVSMPTCKLRVGVRAPSAASLLHFTLLPRLLARTTLPRAPVLQHLQRPKGHARMPPGCPARAPGPVATQHPSPRWALPSCFLPGGRLPSPLHQQLLTFSSALGPLQQMPHRHSSCHWAWKQLGLRVSQCLPAPSAAPSPVRPPVTP